MFTWDLSHVWFRMIPWEITTKRFPGRKAMRLYMWRILWSFLKALYKMFRILTTEIGIFTSQVWCVFVMEIYKRTMSQHFPVWGFRSFQRANGGISFPFPSKRRNPSKRNPGTWFQSQAWCLDVPSPSRLLDKQRHKKALIFMFRFFGLKKVEKNNSTI